MQQNQLNETDIEMEEAEKTDVFKASELSKKPAGTAAVEEVEKILFVRQEDMYEKMTIFLRYTGYCF